ncbi:MAG: hydrogenase maturation protease [Verrucomicrobiota bacterium JB025]|nr:hydrogenase maturation protease [Verrucomicrobiota bacterium JB025]
MSALPPRHSIVVIGVGNPYRGDDAVGRLVARRIMESAPPGVTVREESGEGTALMEAWENADVVFLVDAVQSGGAAGAIHRFDARTQSLPSRFFHYSTHAFSVAESVELARALDRLPPHLIIYGIEGADFSSGEALTPAVAAALDEAALRIRTEIDSLPHPTNPSLPHPTNPSLPRPTNP